MNKDYCQTFEDNDYLKEVNNNKDRETLSEKLNKYFSGKIVRKDLTKKIREGANVPIYVLEYLLGMYCSSENEEDIEPLKNIVFQISEGKFEEAQNNLENLDFFMISRREALLNWIIQEKEKINANNLYEFASSQLVNTKNIEIVKFCLSILAIMNVETDEETIEKVKTLALSDEFTLYCLYILLNLENSNEFLKIVKNIIFTKYYL
mgnify:CR=1 FL=1